jgi:small subunit ribosomal protein S14
MKKFIQKDFNLRRNISKYEDQLIALKTVRSSLLLDADSRLAASIKLSKLGPMASPTKARNRCVLTGRSRGVYNFFKISRMMIKDLASKGLLPGVKKAS